MTDTALHTAIRGFAQSVLARLEEVRAENRDLRSRLDALEQRTAQLDARDVGVREGPPGPVGAPGERGADGRGIDTVELRGGDLIFRFTDGMIENVGRVTGEKGEPGEDGRDGSDGRDGVGIERIRQVEGRLEVRLTDGQEIDLGRVVGPEGEKGEKGERGSDGAPGERGEPGPAGRDGTDGVATREELEALVEERFRDVQARTLADLYRGVFRNGEDYSRGELATWDGCLWLAQGDTRARPGTNGDWNMITKKGRDGRDRT